MLQSTNYGNNLFEVQKLQKKHQTLCAEIDIHQAHKDRICNQGDDLVSADHPQSGDILTRKEALQQRWDELKEQSDAYKAQLDLSLQAKQVRPVFYAAIYPCRERAVLAFDAVDIMF